MSFSYIKEAVIYKTAFFHVLDLFLRKNKNLVSNIREKSELLYLKAHPMSENE
jgi:hypothetical protein